MIRDFFLDNWKGKATSLVIAFAIWYLIKSNLDEVEKEFPIPGTGTIPAAGSTAPPTPLDDTILSPLAPPPIPGSSDKSK